MNLIESIRIVELLANGVNPQTGEVFPMDSPYQNAQTIRALFTALRALEGQKSTKKRKQSLPLNAGNPWTSEEEQCLVSKFDAGTPIEDLARLHGRTPVAITSRLVKLGTIEPHPRNVNT